MDGIPESIPSELLARNLAFGYNFSPRKHQFYDHWKYANGNQVLKLAVGDKTVNIDFLIKGDGY